MLWSTCSERLRSFSLALNIALVSLHVGSARKQIGVKQSDCTVCGSYYYDSTWETFHSKILSRHLNQLFEAATNNFKHIFHN